MTPSPGASTTLAQSSSGRSPAPACRRWYSSYSARAAASWLLHLGDRSASAGAAQVEVEPDRQPPGAEQVLRRRHAAAGPAPASARRPAWPARRRRRRSGGSPAPACPAPRGSTGSTSSASRRRSSDRRRPGSGRRRAAGGRGGWRRCEVLVHATGHLHQPRMALLGIVSPDHQPMMRQSQPDGSSDRPLHPSAGPARPTIRRTACASGKPGRTYGT